MLTVVADYKLIVALVIIAAAAAAVTALVRSRRGYRPDLLEPGDGPVDTDVSSVAVQSRLAETAQWAEESRRGRKQRALEDARREIADFDEAIHEQMAAIGSLQAQYNVAAENREHLLSRVHVAAADVDETEASAIAAEQEVARLEQLAEDNEAARRVESLEAYRQDLRLQGDDTREAIAALEARIADLETQLGEARNRLEHIYTSYADTDQQLAEATAEAARTGIDPAELQEARNKAAAARQAAIEAAATLQALSGDAHSTEAAIVELPSQIEERIAGLQAIWERSRELRRKWQMPEPLSIDFDALRHSAPAPSEFTTVAAVQGNEQPDDSPAAWGDSGPDVSFEVPVETPAEPYHYDIPPTQPQTGHDGADEDMAAVWDIPSGLGSTPAVEQFGVEGNVADNNQPADTDRKAPAVGAGGDLWAATELPAQTGTTVDVEAGPLDDLFATTDEAGNSADNEAGANRDDGGERAAAYGWDTDVLDEPLPISAPLPTGYSEPEDRARPVLINENGEVPIAYGWDADVLDEPLPISAPLPTGYPQPETFAETVVVDGPTPPPSDTPHSHEDGHQHDTALAGGKDLFGTDHSAPATPAAPVGDSEAQTGTYDTEEAWGAGGDMVTETTGGWGSNGSGLSELPSETDQSGPGEPEIGGGGDGFDFAEVAELWAASDDSVTDPRVAQDDVYDGPRPGGAELTRDSAEPELDGLPEPPSPLEELLSDDAIHIDAQVRAQAAAEEEAKLSERLRRRARKLGVELDNNALPAEDTTGTVDHTAYDLPEPIPAR